MEKSTGVRLPRRWGSTHNLPNNFELVFGEMSNEKVEQSGAVDDVLPPKNY